MLQGKKHITTGNKDALKNLRGHSFFFQTFVKWGSMQTAKASARRAKNACIFRVIPTDHFYCASEIIRATNFKKIF